MDSDALEAQRHGGDIVVPPTVLSKLNFFLQFADDEMPESGLSKQLAQFNDDPQPDDPAYAAPMERVHAARESFDERKAADKTAVRVARMEASPPEGPMSTLPEGEGPPVPAGDDTANKKRGDYRDNPSYEDYFSDETLSDLQERIGVAIRDAVRPRKLIRVSRAASSSTARHSKKSKIRNVTPCFGPR